MPSSRLIVRTWFFWSWFGLEEVRLRNAIAALVRGEADADQALQALNARVRRINPALSADLSMTIEGDCRLSVSGDCEEAIEALLDAAPRRTGWRFEHEAGEDLIERVPFRRAPRPSMDRDSQLSAQWEAYVG